VTNPFVHLVIHLKCMLSNSIDDLAEVNKAVEVALVALQVFLGHREPTAEMLDDFATSPFWVVVFALRKSWIISISM